ncbi:DUF3127 domain-containing protein [Balneolaceae bacterium ANBcel3]|nr:DUF3127 domain-containing protein [Balneolaceae bacterium ANBcel3]
MNELSLSGKVIQVLQEQSGESRNGTWRKRDFILETGGQYPKKVCITQWGDKIDQEPVAVDEDVVVSINIESREYNGRWYTDVKAWRINKESGSDGPPAPPPPTPPADGGFDPLADEDDDLPF